MHFITVHMHSNICHVVIYTSIYTNTIYTHHVKAETLLIPTVQTILIKTNKLDTIICLNFVVCLHTTTLNSKSCV